MNVIDELQSRDYIEQSIDLEELKKMLDKEPNTSFYLGIDPTADSLHIGHFIPLMVASYMQKAGMKPIILVGGGTAQIGDPSGKTDMRKMLTKEDLEHNVKCIKKQLERFVDFTGDNAAIIVDNGDWLSDLKYIDFMKEIGSKFTISRMLAAECYKSRLETGLTFFEMGYMLMQSYDFLYLYNKYNCKLEIGGNDQWSNIIGGVELVRKFNHADAYAFTNRLLLTSEGKKMGKTEKGALWLDPEKTTPYEFYQYWRNIGDKDVENVMKMLTYLSLDEIKELTSVEGEEINKAKRVAAFEITKIVHGEDAAKDAEKAADALFSGAADLSTVPTIEVDDGTSILDAIVNAKFVDSRSQAKTLIEQGAITLNETKVADKMYVITKEVDGAIMRKGKKGYCRLIVK